MIEGGVNSALDAVVTIPIRGQTGQTLEVDAVVDTGFNRFLTLPLTLVTELGLPLTGANRVAMADGSEVTLLSYDVTVLWDGKTRDVVAYAADTTPLIGMALLESHSLYVEVEDGGRVVIQAKNSIR